MPKVTRSFAFIAIKPDRAGIVALGQPFAAFIPDQPVVDGRGVLASRSSACKSTWIGCCRRKDPRRE